ncbi:MAG: VOC family protein [Candidatus Krumholzibacteria bacterium]|nr:VOC family protein [Candidatus Krumholzibacteria bacterium]
MARVVHFEIHAENTERAIQFYQKSFGWEFQKWEGPMDYWLVMTGPKDQPGIDGGLVPRQVEIDGQAVIAYVCTIDVPDIDATVSTVEKNGGTIAVPKMAVPTVGWLVYFKDTEGNIFGAMQTDPEAK